MTCIVGIAHEGKAWIGGDSCGSDGQHSEVRSDRKVWVKDGFVYGFTTSFRMGQLLRHAFKPPKRHLDHDLIDYMVCDFVNAVRVCLKDGGFASKEKETECGGTFLVGTGGRLFCVESDYQVGETSCGYNAVGSGGKFALGSLYSTAGEPHERLTRALEAAAFHSCHVCGPFHIEAA